MLVFLTGATGVLGRRAAARLVAAGHDVHGVARDQAKADRLAAAGVTPVTVDLADPAAVRGAVERIGPEAVLHLATHIPGVPAALLPGAWRENDRLRRETSRYLVDAALATGVGRYVQESITLVYSDGGADWLTEDAPTGDGPQERAAAASAEQVARMTGAGRVGVLLRFGSFYSADDAMSAEMIARTRAGKAAAPGPADAFMSPLHLDDAASAVVAALTAPAGIYNVVDDEPVTHHDYVAALAAAVGREDVKVKLLPPALLKVSPRSRPITRSQRVSNRAFRTATGWRPAHPSVATGWKAVLAGGER